MTDLKTYDRVVWSEGLQVYSGTVIEIDRNRPGEDEQVMVVVSEDGPEGFYWRFDLNDIDELSLERMK